MANVETQTPTLGATDPTQAPSDGQLADKASNGQEGTPETPTAGEGEGGQEEQRQEELALHDHWMEHPEAKKALEERYAKGQSDKDKSHRRELDDLEERHQEAFGRAQATATASHVVAQVSEAVGNLGQRLRELDDSDIDGAKEAARELRRVLGGSAEWARVWTGVDYNAGRDAFANEISPILFDGLDDDQYDEMKTMVKTLNKQVERGHKKPADVWKEALNARLNWLVDKAVATKEQEIEGKVRSRLETEDRARERQGGKPPAKVTGTGGGGGKGYTWLEEAEADHARGQIDNNRMRELRRTLKYSTG